MSIVQLRNDNLDSFLAQLGEVETLALDTEFHAERRYTPLLLLIQLQIPGGDTWIVDATKPSLFLSATDALLSKTWVVHGGRYDLLLLNKLLGGLPPQVWDTQIAAGLLELYYPSPYGRLIEQHRNLRLQQHSTLSNWARRPLTDEQIQYAAEDVLHLLPLWETIRQKLEKENRIPLADLLCSQQRDEVLNPAPFDTLYSAHHVLQHLTKHQAAVFQELVAWREKTGQQNNQPARSVLNDGILIELSRRQPSSVDELRKDRRMPKRLISSHGHILLEIIQRAASRPEWGWPEFIRIYSPKWVKMQSLVAFLIEDGQTHHYSQRLVFPDSLLKSLILAPCLSEEDLVKKFGPLRMDLAGKRLWRFLSESPTFTRQN